MLLLAQDLERTLIELLPWLVPVLIAVVAGLGRLMSAMLERRVEKMRRFEEEGGGTKRPSVSPSRDAMPPRDEMPSRGRDETESVPTGDTPPKPRRTILDEIRRYMEMMEERSLGDDRPGTGGERRPEPQPETRRPTSPPSSRPSSPQPAVPERAESRPSPQPQRPSRPQPTTASPSPGPTPRRRSYSDFEGEVPAGASTTDPDETPLSPWADPKLRGSHLPPEMRRIEDDPFAAFWNKKLVGRHSFRPRIDRQSAKRAVVLAALLGPPRADQSLESDPLGPRPH